MGSKNHEVVPTPLIAQIAGLRHGGSHKLLGELARKDLVARVKNTKYDGYRLTYGGYDYLALKTFVKRNTLYCVGNQIGIGKESDIYIVADENENQYVLKIHRLGRVSFRAIKSKRDYLQHRRSASWMYMSRLAAIKEFSFMKVDLVVYYESLGGSDSSYCIYRQQITEVKDPGKLYSDLMDLIVKLAQYGLIHGDFNEFNILVKENGDPVLIDFPQMVSTSHPNAEWYFNRDVECIRTFFRKRYNYESVLFPKFKLDVNREFDLDVQVAASGFTRQFQKELEMYQNELDESQDNAGDEMDDDLDEGSERDESNDKDDSTESTSDDNTENDPGDLSTDDESGSDADLNPEPLNNRSYKVHRDIKKDSSRLLSQGTKLTEADIKSRVSQSLKKRKDKRKNSNSTRNSTKGKEKRKARDSAKYGDKDCGIFD
ncbi:12208_t:CDS:2 [Acaulospora colombiana]|uniref:12208_t:CDS:1 n=1 Tax=Acaulospora colombiana TaxID=27376 RepID=A0ACA9LED8_9GLOM|nr:12208_t:CDS:2 [Acaulospora colombiana]